jgi:cellulase (glycosyl hydrolase family 5)
VSSGHDPGPAAPAPETGGERRAGLVVGVVVAVLVLVFVVEALTGGDSAPSGPGVTPRPTIGQVTAHDGRFWLGSGPIQLRGVLLPLLGPVTRYREIASWGMNLVRLHVNWSRLEPSPPTRGSNGQWVHVYDQGYLATVRQAVGEAHRDGLWVVIGNYKDRATFFGYPDWLYSAPYNSHGLAYPRSPEGFLQAETDFWSDTLRRQFMVDMLGYLAGRLSAIPGIIGYEVLNEPQPGSLPHDRAVNQAIIDFQAGAARTTRRADPRRVIFFMGTNYSDAGLPRDDLSAFVRLGNAALDFHDYFGARWGTGFLQDPADPANGENNQALYAAVTEVPAQSAPYIGSELVQERAIRSVLGILEATGIPLMVGEFGDSAFDPGVFRYFGTISSALNRLGVSWACTWLAVVTDNFTGRPQPWTRIVIAAARTPSTGS